MNLISYSVGIALLAIVLAVAIRVRSPSATLRYTLRTVLALGAALTSVLISGFLHFEKVVGKNLGIGIEAGGALAVFVMVFLFDRDSRATQPENEEFMPSEDELKLLRTIAENGDYEKNPAVLAQHAGLDKNRAKLLLKGLKDHGVLDLHWSPFDDYYGLTALGRTHLRERT